MISLDKTYKTLAGNQVKLFMIAEQAELPVLGAVFKHGVWVPQAWYLDSFALVEVKPSIWVNIFSSFREYNSFSSHDSRLEADSYAKKCALPRFACVEVPEGGGLND